MDITQVPVRWTDKQNVVEAHDGIFLSPKGEAVMSHAASWTNLEDPMRSEISQSQKHKYWAIPLPRGTGVVTHSGMEAARTWGCGGNGE